MLLPALNAARSRAHTISCISNLRQSTQGSRQYADDNNDFIPGYLWGSGGDLTWNAAVYYNCYKSPYVAWKVAMCSLDRPDPANYNPPDGGVIWRNVYAVLQLYSSQAAISSIPNDIAKTKQKASIYPSGAAGWIFSYSKMESPSRFPLLMDCWNSANKASCYDANIYSSTSQRGTMYLRHNQRANIGFGDGHAETLDAGRLKSTIGAVSAINGNGIWTPL